MTNTAIIGIGQTNVSEAWQTSLRHLAWYAIEAALDDAHLGQDAIDVLYVGNMLAGRVNNQRHLGALVADFSGLRGVEAVVVESAEASGASAIRQAVLAVASGQVKTALVVGVEKCSDTSGKAFDAALATSLDVDYEQAHGLTSAAAAALLMRRYMYEHGVTLSDFAGFSVNAHTNGSKNPLAMYRNRLKAERFAGAPLIAEPVSLFDAAPTGDGAAAVIITSAERAADLVPNPIEIIGSAVATDTFALHDRRDLLHFGAVTESTRKALKMAGVTHADIDLFELHDGYTILAALSLEAAGFAARGEGCTFAHDAAIGLGGKLPISTFGGLKARGNPLGATGVYQVVEVARQLRRQAGDNQLPNAQIGMAQSLAGMGSMAVTHILKVD